MTAAPDGLRGVVEHIARRLATGTEDQHRAARQLATALDGAGLNVDRAVDAELDHYPEMTPARAWLPPSARTA